MSDELNNPTPVPQPAPFPTTSPTSSKPAAWADVTYSLLFPVPVEGGAQVTSITLREPNGEMLEQIDDLGFVEGKDATMRQSIALIRILSGQPKTVTDKMHLRDITGAMEAMTPLLEGVL